MEHPINRSSDESDACLSVTALVVVLALVFGIYFSLRASKQAVNALSMLR